MGRISSFHRWSSIENDHRKLFNFTSIKSRDFFIDLDRGIIYIKYVVSKVKNKSLAVYYSICRDYVLFLSLFIAELTAEIVFVIPMNRPE